MEHDIPYACLSNKFHLHDLQVDQQAHRPVTLAAQQRHCAGEARQVSRDPQGGGGGWSAEPAQPQQVLLHAAAAMAAAHHSSWLVQVTNGADRAQNLSADATVELWLSLMRTNQAGSAWVRCRHSGSDGRCKSASSVGIVLLDNVASAIVARC